MRSRQVHTNSTQLLSAVIVLLGVAILVRTLVAGGGVLTYGIVIGTLFVAAGIGRLLLARKL